MIISFDNYSVTPQSDGGYIESLTDSLGLGIVMVCLTSNTIKYHDFSFARSKHLAYCI